METLFQEKKSLTQINNFVVQHFFFHLTSFTGPNIHYKFSYLIWKILFSNFQTASVRDKLYAKVTELNEIYNSLPFEII